MLPDDEHSYEVSTIHAFCIHHILQPYHYLQREFVNGFELKVPDDPWFTKTVKALTIKHSIRPWAAQRFEGIQREPDGSVTVPSGIPREAAEEFLADLDRNSFVSLNDVVFYSYCLVRDFPFISRALASRFAWLLIDEFQDTTASQVAILEKVHCHDRSRFFIVGDPNQSIFGFAGARPELMMEFAQHIEARKDVQLLGNYRCSRLIVQRAERLCSCSPPMKSVGPTRNYPQDPLLIQAPTYHEAILNHFLPALKNHSIPLGNAAVLAPWWIPLYHIAQTLRTESIPVTGPGARPYKRSHVYALFAEHLCAHLQRPNAGSAIALQKALFITLLWITGNREWSVFTYHGKRTLCRCLTVAAECRDAEPTALGWLTSSAIRVAEVLTSDGFLSQTEATALFHSAEAMSEDISSNRSVADPSLLSLEQLGVFARPADCLQLLTMHKAKGREFDAVAVIDLHDDKVPHFRSTPAEVSEARRLLYVAVTRARKLLMLFTDSSDIRNRPSRFLGLDGLDLLSD